MNAVTRKILTAIGVLCYAGVVLAQDPATPVITPAGGLYEAPVTVSIACGVSNAVIRYTLDGLAPTTNSLEYVVAFTADVPVTVSAGAFLDGVATGDVAVAQYWFGTILSNGIAVTNVTAGAGGAMEFKFVIPAAQSTATFSISGGTGECDMLVKFDAKPSTNNYDFYPALTGNEESVTVDSPAAGDWYVSLIDGGTSGFAGVTVTATYAVTNPVVATPEMTPGPGLKLGKIMVELTCSTTGAVIRYTLDGSEPTTNSTEYTVPIRMNQAAKVVLKAKAFKDGWTDSETVSAIYKIARVLGPSKQLTVSGDAQSIRYFAIKAPAWASKMTISLTGGTGDANLFVMKGALPTMKINNWESKQPGNNESIVIPNPKPTKWYYVMLRGKTAFAGAVFKVMTE